jgi:hypothetical protein
MEAVTKHYDIAVCKICLEIRIFGTEKFTRFFVRHATHTPGAFGKECVGERKEWGYVELRMEKSV